jgi:hypothetical protein
LLKITSFSDAHIQDATALVNSRFSQLRQQEPLLPDRYSNVSELLPLLSSISTTAELGVAAIRDGRLVGFLTGWLMRSFRGKRSVYSPEWANAAVLEDSRYIYEEMYSHLAEEWVAGRYLSHYISIFPNDAEAIRAFHWMGFGMTAVDAIRSLEPIPVSQKEGDIRRADMQDLEDLMVMDKALWQHIKGTPDFLLARYLNLLSLPSCLSSLGLQCRLMQTSSGLVTLVCGLLCQRMGVGLSLRLSRSSFGGVRNSMSPRMRCQT